MKPFGDPARKFSNHRQWREFIAAIHASATGLDGAGTAVARVAGVAWSAGPLSGLARKPLGMRINIAMAVAQEAHQREAGRDGEMDR